MLELDIDQAAVIRDGRALLDGVSLQVRPGALTALIGPNGAGKTTLLRAGLGLIRLDGGAVRLGGADPRRMSPAERARRIAYLPQVRPLAWPLQVEAVVALGRFAHGPARSPEDQKLNAAAIADAMRDCRLEELAKRPMDTLSGGETARVHIARALAAKAPLLLADEPMAALDPRHAFETMAILKAFCANGGGAMVTLHDLSLAGRFADRVAILHEGRLIAAGPPAEVFTPALLAEAFGVRARVARGLIDIEGPA